jgi:uncharacterized protein involved in response to NO
MPQLIFSNSHKGTFCGNTYTSAARSGLILRSGKPPIGSEAVSPGRIEFARHPVFALGFRPFYLLAALFAAVAVPLWMVDYSGIVHVRGYLHGIAWHSHEMVFGFATAVIAGFLLTAVRTWTGQSTPVGASLAGFAALWVLARVLALTGPASIAALVDVAFLPVLGLAIAVPILRSKSIQNLKILVVLGGLTTANIFYHLAYLDMLPAEFTRLAITAALDIVTILLAIMGGRVIPAFTANAISAARPRRIWGIEAISVGSLVLILAAGILSTSYPLPTWVWLALLGTAALAHAVRLLLWEPYHRHRNVLLWMLPVAYAWIPVTLVLRVCAQAGVVPSATAVHALTLGAMSGLMVAMMMRSSLGHTGRTLTTEFADIAVFVLVQLAAITRVLSSFIPPEFYQASVTASGILWSSAFVVFVFRYGPILTRPRVDGRSG